MRKKDEIMEYESFNSDKILQKNKIKENAVHSLI